MLMSAPQQSCVDVTPDWCVPSLGSCSDPTSCVSSPGVCVDSRVLALRTIICILTVLILSFWELTKNAHYQLNYDISACGGHQRHFKTQNRSASHGNFIETLFWHRKTCFGRWNQVQCFYFFGQPKSQTREVRRDSILQYLVSLSLSGLLRPST